MKIYNNPNVQNIYQTYNKSRVTKTDKVSAAEKPGFNIEISQAGKDYTFAMEKLKQMPDVRRDKVEELSKKIESGTYQVDKKKLAQAILAGSNVDDLG